MAELFEGLLHIDIRWWMADRPGHGSLKVCCRLLLMQPTLVVGDHRGGANDPDAWLALFHQNMAAGVLLAQRDLTVAANELEGMGSDIGSHGQATSIALH